MTCESGFTFRDLAKHVVVLAAPCGADVAFSIVRGRQLRPSCSF
jgi:hypothetical protein